MSKNGITLQVTKTTGIPAANFRPEMAEKWQKLTAKNGGTLFGKIFIPFGKEGDIGDEIMTNIIQKQNNFLRSTKQRIVQNLNDIDFPNRYRLWDWRRTRRGHHILLLPLLSI
jgi:hypothetical protein